MEKRKYPSDFLMQTQEMLKVLEKLIHAPKGSLSIANSSTVLPHTIYRRQAFFFNDASFDFVLTGSPSSRNLLLCHTVNVLMEYYQNSSYLQGEGRWFYDYAKKKDNSPESLAKIIYQELYVLLVEFYGGALGIDFDIMTALAKAAYEKDAAVGRLFFYTGELSSVELEQWCRPVLYQPVPLCTENVRHMRKLLAGTGNEEDGKPGNSGLLFVRDTDTEEYNFRGYIREEFYQKVFTSVCIDGKGGWELRLDGKNAFCITSNRAYLPPSSLDGMREKLEEELGKKYGGLFPVLEALSAQGHGTSIVFLDLDKKGSFAGKWMKDLARRDRAVAVRPIQLQSIANDPELQAMLKNISRIDGAIVVDYPHGEIRYTNVIVDGKTVVSGRADAGARHNALRAFVANLAKGGEHDPSPVVFACIFSEDGGVSVETAAGCRKDMEKEE